MNNTLPIKSISSIASGTYKYIEGKSEGKFRSMDTGHAALNNAMMDGIEWYRILTIAAMSGGGKSITLEQLKRDLIENNPDEDFDILSYDLEMPGQDQVARNLSGKLGKDLKWLYSIDGNRSKKDLKKIKDAVDSIGKSPIFIVDRAGTVQEIKSTTIDFIVTRKLASRNRGLIVTLDHTLLTKGKQGENEKAIVDNLCKMFVELKQECISMGVRLIVIMLSQLNRDIEKNERVLNPLLHYPMRSDIFAASSVFYCSDYVLVSHKPSLVNGIEQFYGPPRNPEHPQGLPVYNPDNPTQAMVYWHLIKNRFGEPITISMVDMFKFARIEEYKKHRTHV